MSGNRKRPESTDQASKIDVLSFQKRRDKIDQRMKNKTERRRKRTRSCIQDERTGEHINLTLPCKGARVRKMQKFLFADDVAIMKKRRQISAAFVDDIRNEGSMGRQTDDSK